MEWRRVRREASWVGLRRSSKVREKARAMSSEGMGGVLEVGVGVRARVLRRGAIDTCWVDVVIVAVWKGVDEGGTS